MPIIENVPLADVTPYVKLTVAGEFWDSQIYSGILTLFTQDRRFLRLDWRSFVSNLPIGPELKVAAEIVFLGNRALYDAGAKILLRDPDVRGLIIRKFIKLSGMDFTWSEQDLPWSSVRDNRFPFPHNDSDIHYNTLYVGSSNGVHSLAQDRRIPVAHSDVPAFDLAVKYQTVAYAAGDEGLYEIDNIRQSRSVETQISEMPCVRCEWTYASIIASGPNNEIYIAEFDRSRKREAESGRYRTRRRLERVIKDDELFLEPRQIGRVGLTWGARNRLFRFTGDQIEVVSCTARTEPQTERRKLYFQRRGTLPAMARMISDGAISARVAPFGSVIELHDGLLVIPTRGEAMFFPGEPTNWRVFPRSTDYLNHLHIVYEDHLDVIAFTHDYFVADQSSKMVGFSIGSDEAEEF